jgi:hypothetical protein
MKGKSVHILSDLASEERWTFGCLVSSPEQTHLVEPPASRRHPSPPSLDLSQMRCSERRKWLSSLDIGKLIPKAVWLVEPIEDVILALGEFHLCISQKRDSFRKRREGQFSKKIPPVQSSLICQRPICVILPPMLFLLSWAERPLCSSN